MKCVAVACSLHLSLRAALKTKSGSVKTALLLLTLRWVLLALPELNGMRCGVYVTVGCPSVRLSVRVCMCPVDSRGIRGSTETCLFYFKVLCLIPRRTRARQLPVLYRYHIRLNFFVTTGNLARLYN